MHLYLEEYNMVANYYIATIHHPLQYYFIELIYTHALIAIYIIGSLIIEY